MSGDPKLELLRRVPIFAALGRKELQRVAQLCDEVDLPAGRMFIQEGAIAHEFFIIVDGEVTIAQQGRQLRTMRAGDFLGEIALIDGKPRTATASTTKPTILLVVGHREFRSLLHEHPAIQLSILQALAARVRNVEPESD